jgi:hypothetical protein
VIHRPSPEARSQDVRSGLRVVLASACAGLLILPACASTTSSRMSDPLPTAALSTSLMTPGGTWAVVPMGHRDVVFNTFWQLFFRPVGGSSWALVTPRGVADNGGLVMAVGDNAPVIVGFLPNQNLQFSPVARSSDDGRTWMPGAIDDALESDPDALATSSDGASFALVRSDGERVLLATGSDLTTWHTLVTRRALAGSRAGTACGVDGIVAVTVDERREPLIGTTCSKEGIVGIFAESHGRWTLDGPSFRRRHSTTADVLRLVATSSGVASLLSIDTGDRRTIVAAWRDDESGAWTVSPSLDPPASGRIVSTGIGDDGDILVEAMAPGRPIDLSAIDGPTGRWRQWRAPPPGTQAVVPGPDGEVDALSVHNSVLTDWVLATPTGSWTRNQTLRVPIFYGSSN